MLSLGGHDGGRPEIVRTVATSDEGTAELVRAVERFLERAEKSGVLARKRRGQLAQQFQEALQQLLLERTRQRALPPAETERLVDSLAARETDPFTAARGVLSRMGL
jgi:putative protein kinase ArgK-like GTPase of G3E family